MHLILSFIKFHYFVDNNVYKLKEGDFTNNSIICQQSLDHFHNLGFML